MKVAMPTIVRGDARLLPLDAGSVDLIVTSPPYFGLRSYTDDGVHYAGQVGAERDPAGYLDTLIECTREMVRVLKPQGSIFVNLGDRYAARRRGPDGSSSKLTNQEQHRPYGPPPRFGVPNKSLQLLPERYRIRCVDELGLFARAVIIWSKPNGLPESVTDRVRRSHEDWVHLTVRPRYYSAVDEIREPHIRGWTPGRNGGTRPARADHLNTGLAGSAANPRGALPGSVWEVATQPLNAPSELGVDHFAAFPMEWPRRLILGWSPREVCTRCGEGRRPVRVSDRPGSGMLWSRAGKVETATGRRHDEHTVHTVTGYACTCPDTSAPATPGLVLDPFGGTGTTALVATMLGRRGITVDRSSDYCRLANWRASDPKERARAAGLPPDEVAAIRRRLPGQQSLFDDQDVPA